MPAAVEAGAVNTGDGDGDGGSDDIGESSSSRLYTLYFIRHGEALHNRLEKQAQAQALALAVSQGYAPDSPYAARVQEEARRSILESDTIEDPPLSEAGFEEARGAKKTLERLIETCNLPRVEEVWVSPLQRAMQTAATIFPKSESNADHAETPAIKVKVEIEERHSGLACDRHSSLENIGRRGTFKSFSLSCLRLDELLAEVGSEEDSFSSLDNQGGEVIWEDRELTFPVNISQSTGDRNVRASSLEPIEDKSMLRERTKKLFDLLAETESRTICLIGHKGYLRELERGPLGKNDAKLFQNCEVRVYRLSVGFVDGEGSLDIGEEVANNNAADCVQDCQCEGDTMDGKDVKYSLQNSPHLSGRRPVLQRAEKVASSFNLG
ncbi:hypothetical protein ACHAWF_010238 [Thalassiosira exigua]